MGKSLVIKGADFSANALPKDIIISDYMYKYVRMDIQVGQPIGFLETTQASDAYCCVRMLLYPNTKFVFTDFTLIRLNNCSFVITDEDGKVLYSKYKIAYNYPGDGQGYTNVPTEGLTIPEITLDTADYPGAAYLYGNLRLSGTGSLPSPLTPEKVEIVDSFD